MFKPFIKLEKTQFVGKPAEFQPRRQSIRNLEKLWLVDNNLTEVSRASFAGLVKLKHLDLTRNPLDLIDPSVFVDLVSLETVKSDSINYENKHRFEQVYGDRINFVDK